ncbi:MAG: alpha/beta fold hydrolase [Dehalococcoidia bacterium]
MKRGYVETPHGQIHYREEGSGPPVILFHETPSSSVNMIPMIQALSPDMRAIGMDTMGYGESDRPPTPYTTMEEFAQSVAWFIQGLGLEKANLFGMLTGSQIALQTAADFPELVSAVAVQEPFNWGTPSRRAVHERIHRYHTRREDGGHLMELWERTRYSKDLKEREVALKNLLKVNDDSGAEVYGSMGWEGAAPYAMCRQDMWSVTPRIVAPTLVMYFPGSERHRALERFLETLPHGKGTREAPTFRSEPEATKTMLLDFYKNPGG